MLYVTLFTSNPVVFNALILCFTQTELAWLTWHILPTYHMYVWACFCSQTVGCVASLLLISPKLSGVMLIIIPTVIGGGTLLGSILRKLSREAQEQVLCVSFQGCALIVSLLNTTFKTFNCVLFCWESWATGQERVEPHVRESHMSGESWATCQGRATHQARGEPHVGGEPHVRGELSHMPGQGRATCQVRGEPHVGGEPTGQGRGHWSEESWATC